MQSAGVDVLGPRHTGLEIQPKSAPCLSGSNDRKRSVFHDFLKHGSWNRFSFLRSKTTDGPDLDISYLSNLSTQKKKNRARRRRSLDSQLDAAKEEKLKDRASVRQSSDIDRVRYRLLLSELESLIQVTTIEELLNNNGPFRDIANGGVYDGVWWLDVTDPSPEEIETLANIFAIHPLTTEDIMTEEPREKTELFEKYYFVSLTLSQLSGKGSDFRPSNTYAIVFRNGIISCSFGDNPHAANVRRRIKNLHSHLNVTSDWICYALM